MSIKDLNSKVSSDDVERVKTKRNAEFAPGFEPGSGGSEDDIFDSIESLTGGWSGSGVQDPTGANPNVTGLVPGAAGIPGAQVPGTPVLNNTNPLMQGMQNQAPVQPKETTYDKVFNASAEGMQSTARVIVDALKSIKNRNVDDMAYLGRNLIMVGAGMALAGVILSILGAAYNLEFVGIRQLGRWILFGGLPTIGEGIIVMGVTTFRLAGGDVDRDLSVNDVPDIASRDNTSEEIEEDLESFLGGLFGEDEVDSDESESDGKVEFAGVEDYSDKLAAIAPKTDDGSLDYAKLTDNVREKQHLCRETLFRTFKPFFMTNTKDFATVYKIDEDSDEFATLEAICLKAMSNILNCEVEEVNSQLEEAYQTLFSYDLKVRMIRRLTKLNELERELEAYFKEDRKDKSVVASVDREGDFYRIVVSKGTKNVVVTIGDVLQHKEHCEFILNKDNRLPMITGVDEMGHVLMEDAGFFDAMMIAGKPRSGKSWFIVSTLMTLMTFNTPEDVTLLVVDPKSSNMFKTIRLMPHTIGLHGVDTLLELLNEIIDVEGGRRKKLLADHSVEDIWELRDNGVNLPVLYIIIDEIVSIRNKLKEQYKEFEGCLQAIISQLPSLGIRLIIVPHRATGIVDKTNRTMFQFTAAVKSDPLEVKETLGIPKWDRVLVNQGDMAIKSSNMLEAKYVRGAAVASKNRTTTQFIREVARAYYKMGVDIPDYRHLKVAYNRDDKAIREELNKSSIGTNSIQYNAGNWDNGVGNMEFDDDEF